MSTLIGALIAALCVIAFWTVCDVWYLHGTLWQRVKFFYNTRIIRMLANLGWALVGEVLLLVFAASGHMWQLAYALVAAFYTIMAIRYWWNKKGRKKLTEKLAGYKHRFTLAKMGLVPAPVGA